MGYRITIDRGNCINCGVCMDVCPVQALDMTRPRAGGIETGGVGRPFDWMMEYPVQVGECIGCNMCIRECPVVVMTLDSVAGPTPLEPRQGPLSAPPDGARLGAALGGHQGVAQAGSPGALRRPLGLARIRATAAVADVARAWSRVARTPRRRARPPAPRVPMRVAMSGSWRQGRYDEAYAVAAEVNPFPSVCGWICTAPCEASCRRGTLDEPIAIRTLKRFAVEHGSLPPITPPRASDRSVSPSSAAVRPACRPPTTSPDWATRSPCSRRCRCPAA